MTEIRKEETGIETSKNKTTNDLEVLSMAELYTHSREYL